MITFDAIVVSDHEQMLDIQSTNSEITLLSPNCCGRCKRLRRDKLLSWHPTTSSGWRLHAAGCLHPNAIVVDSQQSSSRSGHPLCCVISRAMGIASSKALHRPRHLTFHCRSRSRNGGCCRPSVWLFTSPRVGAAGGSAQLEIRSCALMQLPAAFSDLEPSRFHCTIAATVTATAATAAVVDSRPRDPRHCRCCYCCWHSRSIF